MPFLSPSGLRYFLRLVSLEIELMMKWLGGLVLPIFLVALLSGCSSSSESLDTTAEHDELSQWVAENPEPEDNIDPDAE